jgi:aryl-alcohol dehydrogenase-like predicted oxidoreductase
MTSRALGHSDLNVSRLGLGCVTFGREIGSDESYSILDYARDRGITLLDTAAAYADGASETLLGKWFTDRGCRNQFVLATKVTGTLTESWVVRSAEESLKRLRTDRIDLLQLHAWDDNTPLEETFRGLNRLVQSGKIRWLGCSNFSLPQLTEALHLAGQIPESAFTSIQPPYNLVQREIEGDMLALCREHQIGVIGYSPLAAGFLTGKYARDGRVPANSRFDVVPGHQPIYFTDRGFAVLDAVRNVALEYETPMTQLALAWALNNSEVTSVLIGARSIAHIDQATSAFQLVQSNSLKQQLTNLSQNPAFNQ